MNVTGINILFLSVGMRAGGGGGEGAGGGRGLSHPTGRPWILFTYSCFSFRPAERLASFAGLKFDSLLLPFPVGALGLSCFAMPARVPYHRPSCHTRGVEFLLVGAWADIPSFNIACHVIGALNSRDEGSK